MVVASLGKEKKLLKPDQFKRAYKDKHWGAAGHFSFNICVREDGQNQSTIKPVEQDTLKSYKGPRIGVTVSKKVSKRAVDRNRIKRQVREFVRPKLNKLTPVDLVITARPSSLQATDKERLDSLAALWNKILSWQRWYLKNNAPSNKLENKG